MPRAEYLIWTCHNLSIWAIVGLVGDLGALSARIQLRAFAPPPMASCSSCVSLWFLRTVLRTSAHLAVMIQWRCLLHLSSKRTGFYSMNNRDMPNRRTEPNTGRQARVSFPVSEHLTTIGNDWNTEPGWQLLFERCIWASMIHDIPWS